MSEIKVSVTFSLPGRVMYNNEECTRTIKKEITKKNNKTGKSYKKIIEEQVDDWHKMDKNVINISCNGGKNNITVYTRKYKKAKQSINFNKDTYNYMVSNECPSFSTMSHWKRLKPIQRLEEHIRQIAEHLNATLLDYKVFED